MCKLTPEGYLMKDGTIIPLNEKLDISQVSPEHIEDLNTSYSTQLDSLLVRQGIIEIKECIDNLSNYKHICNPSELLINKFVQKELSKQPAKRFAKLRNNAKNISIFLLVVIQVITLYKIFQ